MTKEEFDALPWESIVVPTSPKHKGKPCFYDDNEGGNMYLYPDGPGSPDCLRIHRRYVRVATKKESDDFLNEHREVIEKLNALGFTSTLLPGEEN